MTPFPASATGTCEQAGACTCRDRYLAALAAPAPSDALESGGGLRLNREVLHQRVFLAADSLLAGGCRPTNRRVRSLMGHGSFREISGLLKAWWQAPKAHAASGGGNLSVPSAVEREALQAELVRAEERYEGLRRQLLLETDRIRQEVGSAAIAERDRTQRLQDEINYLKGRIRVLEQDNR